MGRRVGKPRSLRLRGSEAVGLLAEPVVGSPTERTHTVPMPQTERRPFGRFTGSQAVIVLVSLVIVAIVVALAFRVASDDSERGVDPYSAQSATEPVAAATDSATEASNRLGIAEATAAFGLIVLWVLAGTVVIVRARRGKQPRVRTAE